MVPSKTLRSEVLRGVWIDSRRAVFIEEFNLLAVADAHWGYADSHRAAGNLLPVWGDEEIARRLESLLADYAPREMLWLGDSLHTLTGRIAAETFVARHADRVQLTILAGNHDRHWTTFPGADGCIQRINRTISRGKFFFHHGDLPQDVPPNSVELIGHHHPSVSLWDGAGTRLKVPALVVSPQRLILPAFSPWAAGTPWNDRVESHETLWAVAPSRIFAVKAGMLRSRTSST